MGRQFLAKLTIFKLFGIMVMSYMGFSRIMPFILRIISKLKYWWVINVAKEICGLLFSIFVFYIFKLIEGTPERVGEVEMQPHKWNWTQKNLKGNVFPSTVLVILTTI